MKIVLQCWSSHDDTCGCDYALVDLTHDLARLMLDRIRIFQQLMAKDTGVCDLRWWNCDALYFSPWGAGNAPDDSQPSEKETGRMERDLSALDDGKEMMEAGDDFALGEEMEARTECDRMIVQEDGVSFSCIPKHTDVRITTGTIPVDIVKRAAAGGGTGIGRRKRRREQAA